MNRQKANTKPVAGYRAPRTAAEQRFWDSNKPDFRAWSVKKKLTIDEATALAMGLDPTCIPWLAYEENQTPVRFNATRKWFQRHEKHMGKRIDLLTISVIGDDYHLPLPWELSKAALSESEGFFERDRLVRRQERQIEKLKKKIDGLNAKVAANFSHKSKRQRVSDVKNRENTSSKIIVALMAANIRDEAEWKKQFQRIKNYGHASVVSKVKSAIQQLNWKVDDASILERFREALVDWDPSQRD